MVFVDPKFLLDRTDPIDSDYPFDSAIDPTFLNDLTDLTDLLHPTDPTVDEEGHDTVDFDRTSNAP